MRIEPLKADQAPSAILELVDGPKDIRFAMTARTIARERSEGRDVNKMTARNIDKVTRFRKDGEEELEGLVRKMGTLDVGERRELDIKSEEKRWGGKM